MKYNKNYYLVSSRLDEYIQYLDEYDVAHMQQLSLEQSSELVRKTEYEKKIKSQFLNELSTTLYHDYRDFASSPLLLLIMLMTYEENAEIPRKRTDFYSEAFSTLYKKHDATKSGYKRILFSGLQYESFKAVISVFSAISYFNDDITFTEDDVFQYLDSSKKSTNLEFDSEKYLRDLTQSVCVLAQDGLYYTYTHKTFQEYFVARFLIGTEASVRRKIFEKKAPFNRLEANILIELLYEIDSNLTEVDLVIPTLQNLKKLTRYEETERRKSYLHLSEILNRRNLMGSSESFIAYSDHVSTMCSIDQNSVNTSLYEIDQFLESDRDKAPELSRDFLKAYESLMASLDGLEQKHKNVERSIEEMLNI